MEVSLRWPSNLMPGCGHESVVAYAYGVRAHLTDVLSLGLLHAHEEVIKGGVAIVLPVVLDAIPLHEAHLGQGRPLLLCVEGHMQTGHAHLICIPHPTVTTNSSKPMAWMTTHMQLVQVSRQIE